MTVRRPALALLLSASAFLLLLSSACRVEFGAPATTTAAHDGGADDTRPRGKVVLYTSAYREVADAWTALSKQQLPDV